jgi:hypothetical protein
VAALQAENAALEGLLRDMAATGVLPAAARLAGTQQRRSLPVCPSLLVAAQ